MARLLTATNLTRGVSLAQSTRLADTFSSRLVGLLADKTHPAGARIWIVPCNSIHSFGMRFTFDALFLDKNLRVVHLIPEMKPWRASKIVFSAHGVLELPAGLISQTATALGDQLEISGSPSPG
jgi:uncharacterized membrane protein (UPF0127 family)